jgi:hypothetical protein
MNGRLLQSLSFDCATLRTEELSVSPSPFSEGFQFYDAGSVTYLPGDDLAGVLTIIGFDDGPSAVSAVVAAPFKVMEVAGGVDLLDDGIAILGFMRRFDKITIHEHLSLIRNG